MAKSVKGGQYCAFFAKGGQVSKKVAIDVRFSQKVAKSEKVAFAFLFSEMVAKSVERWLMLCDFRERWPSHLKGGQNCAIFAKGGQVSRKVANVVRFSQKVAKSVERWPLMCDFRERWPSQ